MTVKRIVLPSILLIVLVLLVSAYIAYKPVILTLPYSAGFFKQQNLEFSVKPCNKDTSRYDKEKLGIREVNWINNTTLSVKAYVSTYCGGVTISYPSYKIEGNNIVFGYTLIRGRILTKCLCTRELEYTIYNLTKDEYNPILNEKVL